MENDPAAIINIFSITTFSTNDFLDSLKTSNRINDYLNALEKTKLVASYTQVTLDFLESIASLKAR
jgi:hypothetical protein